MYVSIAQKWALDGGGLGNAYIVSGGLKDLVGSNDVGNATADDQPMAIENGSLREDGIYIDSSDSLLGSSGWDLGTSDGTIFVGGVTIPDATPGAEYIYVQSHNAGNNRLELSLQTAGTWRLSIVDGSGVVADYDVTLSAALVDGESYALAGVIDRDDVFRLEFWQNGSVYAAGEVDISGSSAVEVGSGNASVFQVSDGSGAIVSLESLLLFDQIVPEYWRMKLARRSA